MSITKTVIAKWKEYKVTFHSSRDDRYWNAEAMPHFDAMFAYHPPKIEQHDIECEEFKFEPSVVWDLANQVQTKFLQSIHPKDYAHIMSNIETLVMEGHDYQTSINIVLGK